MTVIANLVARISADSSGFQRGVKGASSALSQFGGLLPAITVGAVAAFVKSTIDGADAMRDMAIKTNTSTEFLSQMQHVAELSGVSFDTFASSLTKMQSSLVNISRSDKATEQLSALGVNVADLLKLSPEKQFLAIGDALQKIEDPAVRTNTAIKIFGRSGAELQKIFREGGAGIAAMRAEADALGVTLSTEAADGADRANDALSRIKATFSGLTTGVARDFLPAIADAIEFFARGLPKVLGFVGGAVRSVGEVIGGVSAAAVQAAQGNFRGAGEIIGGLPADLADNFDGLNEETKSQTEVLTDINRNIQRGVPAVAQ